METLNELQERCEKMEQAIEEMVEVIGWCDETWAMREALLEAYELRAQLVN